jgi:hypothetical protein
MIHDIQSCLPHQALLLSSKANQSSLTARCCKRAMHKSQHAAAVAVALAAAAAQALMMQLLKQAHALQRPQLRNSIRQR